MLQIGLQKFEEVNALSVDAERVRHRPSRAEEIGNDVGRERNRRLPSGLAIYVLFGLVLRGDREGVELVASMACADCHARLRNSSLRRMKLDHYPRHIVVT